VWLAGVFVVIGLALVAVFAAAFHFSRGKLGVAVLAPAVVMAAFGAFAGLAAASLSTAPDRAAVVLRGALTGFLQGLVLGAVLAGCVSVYRRLRR
jgi:hypothetical protein